MNKYQFEHHCVSLIRTYGISFEECARRINNQLSYTDNLRLLTQYLEKRGPLHTIISAGSQYHHEAIQSHIRAQQRKKKHPIIRTHLRDQGIKPQKPNAHAWDNVIMVACDTETAYNDHATHPEKESITILLQLYTPETGSICIRKPIMGMRIFEEIQQHAPSFFQEKKTTCFCFHNISFDVYQLFGQEYKELFFQDHPNVKKSVLGLQSFIEMTWNGYKILILDSMNFYPMSLKKIGTMFHLEHQKLDPPPWLGEREPLTPTEWEELETYGIGDIHVQWDICQMIKENQINKNLGPCLTIAEVSRKDYVTNYLERPLLLPSDRHMCAFMYKAKHGAITCAYMRGYDTTRLWDYYDVNGLYTWAMLENPLPFSPGYESQYAWYYDDQWKDPRYEGVAYASFRFPKHVLYPNLPVLGDKLYFPTTGSTYCTFTELRFAASLGAKIDVLGSCGFMLQETDYVNSLQTYVRMNATAKDAASKMLASLDVDHPEYGIWQQRKKSAKDGPNTIYGKSSQVTEGIAGSFYHPLMGTLILAYARTKMFQYLAQCQRLGIPVAYIDTDCLIVPKDSLPSSWLDDHKTGMLKSETNHVGFYPYIIRSKFLLGLQDDHIMKLSHHAIRLKGGLDKDTGLTKEDLRTFLLEGKEFSAQYTSMRFTKMRESLHRPITPNKIISRTFTYNVAEDGKRQFDTKIKCSKDLSKIWLSSTPLWSV